MTFNEQLQWLVKMASNPGFKAHAWHRAKELASCESGLWPEMDKRLQDVMRSQSPSPSEPSARSTPESTTWPAPGA